MIHVIATIELQPGTRDKYLRVFSDLKPHVLAEQGCIEYGAAIDLASGLKAQEPLRENTVVIVEKWASLEALNAHLAAPHMLTYRERAVDLVARGMVQVLEPVD